MVNRIVIEMDVNDPHSLFLMLLLQYSSQQGPKNLQAIAKRVETLIVKHPIMRDIEVSTF